MRQIVYTSTANPDLGQDDVFQIVQTSAQNNGDAGLGGFLVYLNGSFFQVLEGPDNELQQTLGRIQQDDRHTDLKILSDCPIEKPQFSRWRMRRIVLNSEREIPSIVSQLDEELHDTEVVALLHHFARSKCAEAEI